MRVQLTPISSNSKTGPIPVSMTEKASCPNDCPLAKNGCYAAVGHINMHWNNVSNGKTGMDWDTFVDKIRRLPMGILWRHNQAGDLPMKVKYKLPRDNKGRFIKIPA